MVTQEEFDRLQAAFAKADAAADADPNDAEALEDARAFAAEIRRLTGQAGAQPQAQAAPAPQQPAPQPEADTYLSRSVDGIKRMFRAAIGDRPAQDIATGVKTMAQGLPFVGGYTDNLYAKARSAITGENEEAVRQAYMAPVEQMDPISRTALQVGGGLVSPVLPGVGQAVKAIATKPGWTVPITAALESVISGPGRRDNGRPVVNDIVEHALPDAVVGAAGGAAGLTAAEVVSRIVPRAMNMARTFQMKPTDPFVGRGAAKAHARVKAAAEANDPIRTDAPLLAQPAGASLGKEVAGYGGPTAKTVRDAAKEIMGDNSRTQQAGTAFQRLGIVPVGKLTPPTDIAASPRIASNAVLARMNHPDMKKIVSGVERDVRFDGIPRDNLTFVHEVQTRLSDASKSMRKDAPAKAKNIDALRAFFVNDIEAALPGYKDALGEYRDAARATSAAQDMAKAAGGGAKFVKSEVHARVPNPGENVSGSVAGAATRSMFNYGSLLAEMAGLSNTKRSNEIIARILTERDPEQIAMMVRMLSKPHGNKSVRSGLVYQSNNALTPWRSEEAR